MPKAGFVSVGAGQLGGVVLQKQEQQVVGSEIVSVHPRIHVQVQPLNGDITKLTSSSVACVGTSHLREWLLGHSESNWRYLRC